MILNADIAQQIAKSLLQIKAVILQPNKPFTWASGWNSPIYCDNRITLSHPEVRTYIRQEIAQAIISKYGKPDVIAGVATGAIAQGVLVAQELGIPFVYVRASAKGHGRQNLIEGKVESGQSVVVVEDLISSGRSSLMAVEVLREAGCDVKGMGAIFTYSFEAANQNFKNANCEIFTLGDSAKTQAISLIKSIYQMFISTDANMVEVNPLILTKEEKIICLDAKVNFDSNALFRHPEIAELRDLNEEDPIEIEASRHDLAYIKLDGSIGCMVNGAGLAMATMDIIKLYGKEPANFLDVGGGASKEKVSAALKIILSDKNVKGILVNIFGGIMRCDVLAQGIVDAAKEINISVPLVVRLAGTNYREGKEILDNSGLKLISAENLDDAAKKIVEAIK